VVHLDDTPWKVIVPETDENGQPSFTRKELAHQARMFAIRSGDLIVYRYAPNKKGQQIIDFLQGFHGIIVCDEYRGNLAAIEALGLTVAHCWAHVQTKLKLCDDARFGEPLQSLIRQMYDIENVIDDWPPDKKAAYRRLHTEPLITAFMTLAAQAVAAYTPKHPIAVACTYALRLNTGLRTFLSDGRIPIDNNPIEHGFRPVAISRRNSLFSYSERGARTTALFLSLVQSCRLMDVDPHAYLVWLFGRVAAGVVLDWSALLPTRFQALVTATAAPAA
jgi:hypothetical protein